MKAFQKKIIFILLCFLLYYLFRKHHESFEDYDSDESSDDEEKPFDYTNLKILYEGKSEYQTIKLAEDKSSKDICLFLNGDIQNHSREFSKSHHAMVDISISIKPKKPNRETKDNVLILGGGDGFPAKHMLQFKNKNITNVEIDRELVKLVKTNDILRKQTENSFNNKKLNLIIDDAYKHILNDKDIYDIIIHDIDIDTDQNESKNDIYEFDYRITDKMLDEYGILNYTEDTWEYNDGTPFYKVFKYYKDMNDSDDRTLLLVFHTEDHFKFLKPSFLFDTTRLKNKHKNSQIGIIIYNFERFYCGNHDYGSEMYMYVAKQPFSQTNKKLIYHEVDLEEMISY
jgi:spermidine synthase